MIKTLCLGSLLLFGALLRADEVTPVTVRLDTPHPGFSVQIEQVVLKDDVLHVLARIAAPANDGETMFAMVITEISDTVTVPSAAKEQKVYLLGRSWNWGDEAQTALKDADEFARLTAGGAVLPIQR